MEALKEFSFEGLRKNLRDAYEDHCLEDALRAHWQQYVPHTFSGLQTADVATEDRKAQKYLFKPMETFICQGDPDEVFKELKSRANPDVICAKTFKMGEPTYSCRDCGMDPTCVLCVDCFQNSTHKKHRYRMSTSGGGGFCDCGDVEAWKKDPVCSVHGQGLNQEQKDSLAMLPPGMQDKTEELFSFLLQHIVSILLWSNPDTLPAHLGLEEYFDTFVTMLFNDEVHTYDQVINALLRAINCDHKVAVDFATIVDREGRSVVLHGNQQTCNDAKEIIMKQTSHRMGSAKPLKTEVMHTSVVAHQNFAMKLMSWLMKLAGEFDCFRKILGNSFLCQRDTHNMSVVEEIMRNDTDLWKAARIQAHQLIMSVVLADPETKKTFAIIFTKVYPELMKAFVTDDHDHTVCVVSETVQLFTVPTVAKMLISDHDLMNVIMQTFLKECAQVTVDGRFALQKTDHRHAFKRAQYCLNDLKYALVCRPKKEEWDDNLRASFSRGFKAFLDLLKTMQGMDSVKRQENQHIEFEPEWEAAFNLQLKLEDNIYMMLQWCCSDVEVLKDSMRLSLECLNSMTFSGASYIIREVGGHEAKCIDYDVSKDLVSVHVPVSRLVAGLFPQVAAHHLTLLQFLDTCKSPATDLNTLVLQLMEPSLRCLVLVSQVQAGMWKRNGYALLNQVYFYSNVRCRSQMFDKDITMLQTTGAIMTDPNEFLINIINKFGLVMWSSVSFTDPNAGPIEERLRQLNLIAEEFLDLLVIVFGERYTQGVSGADNLERIKREVIHFLCIQAQSHSELDRALPDDPYHESGLEEVIHLVANFKQPTGNQTKGIYELKPECYAMFNPNFYHYSRAEKTKAEDAQRLRKRQQNLDPVLPPPAMPPFTPQYSPLLRVLNCDMMFHLIRLVLERSGGSRMHLAWTETHLEKTLYLIGIAVQEEEQCKLHGVYSFEITPHLIEPLPNIIPGHSGGSSSTSVTTQSMSILTRLENLIGHEHISVQDHHDLLIWLVKKIYAVAQLDPSQSLAVTTHPKELENVKTQQDKKKKADQAAKRRAKLMSKMAAMQKTFIQQNEDLFVTTPTELTPVQGQRQGAPATVQGQCQNAPATVQDQCQDAPATVQDQCQDAPAADVSMAEEQSSGSQATLAIQMDLDGDDSDQVCLGPRRSCTTAPAAALATCILCQEQQSVSALGRAVVMAAFIQRSTVLSKNRVHYLEDADIYNPLFTPADLFSGVHVSTCGHVMHADCWQRFYENIIQRERRRLRFRSHHIYDVERNEYLCPYCKALGNTVIPIVPNPAVQFVDNSDVELHFNDWLDGIQKTVKTSIQKAQDQKIDDSTGHFLYEHVPRSLSAVSKMMADSVASKFQAFFELVTDETPQRQYSESITDMMKKFSKDVHTLGLNVKPNDSDERIPSMLWSACAFTVMSIENLLRLEHKPVFEDLASRQRDCLSSLVRLSACCYWAKPHRGNLQRLCVSLLSALLLDGEGQLVEKTPCLVDIDLFHYLVSLTLTLPYLYDDVDSEQHRIPSGDLNDLHVLSLVTSAHVVQILLTMEHKEESEAMDVGGDDEDAMTLLALYHEVRVKAKLPVSFNLSPWPLKQYLHRALIPFLRCSALFYHYLTDVPVPEALKTNQPEDLEFEALCNFLGLPPQLSWLFNRGRILNSLVPMWSSRCEDVLQGGTERTLTRHPFQVNQLVNLPHDYSDIINEGAAFTCPNSNGDESRAPTMCLVCGEMLCSQSYCCQTKLYDTNVGSATAHAYTCGAGTGIFLRVRECQVLLLCGINKGCFYLPPYLDMYGETDQGLRRGNPLFLSEVRYRRLQRLWLSHSIPEEIAHSLEGNGGMLNIDWNHL